MKRRVLFGFLLLAFGNLLANMPPLFNVDPKDGTEVGTIGKAHRNGGPGHFWVCGEDAHRDGRDGRPSGNVTGPTYPGDCLGHWSPSGCECHNVNE